MENRHVVVLTSAQMQRVLQVVVDKDAAGALDFVKGVVHPQVEAALKPGQCRPPFELASPESRPAGPPPPTPPVKG